MAIRSLKKLREKVKKNDSYWVERAKLHYAISFNRFFEKKGITQAELAKNISTSSAYITKVFRGDTNYTIETMVKLARAVDGELRITIIKPEEKNAWNNFISHQNNKQIKAAKIWANNEKENSHAISTEA